MSKSPDAFRTISEVAEWLGIQAHVLRFWESKFSQVKPVKRAGGRRYYRPSDMQLLGGIKKLLHDDGLTIKGVQKMLREHGVSHVSAMSQGLEEFAEATSPDPEKVVPFQSAGFLATQAKQIDMDLGPSPEQSDEPELEVVSADPVQSDLIDAPIEEVSSDASADDSSLQIENAEEYSPGPLAILAQGAVFSNETLLALRPIVNELRGWLNRQEIAEA